MSNDDDGNSKAAPGRKKERVLHTRVSADFEDELKRRATELGTSVSGLVRHTLSHTSGVVQSGMADNVAAAQDGMRVGWVIPAQGSHAESKKPQLLGWQELVLNLNAVCDQCNNILPKGSRASIAIYEGSGPRTFLCLDCLGKIGNE
ncbi:MAG: hypothetical protein MJE77_04370 [Proteobacteria bacterium]|nr:hypothetical protein [Pseudomonadota bacterium]